MSPKAPQRMTSGRGLPAIGAARFSCAAWRRRGARRRASPDLGRSVVAEMKPASKADGARYTPAFSIAWKKRLKRSTSQRVASAKLVTRGASVKKKPNMPHT